MRPSLAPKRGSVALIRAATRWLRAPSLLVLGALASPLVACEPPARQSTPSDPFGITPRKTPRPKTKAPSLLGVPMSSPEPLFSPGSAAGPAPEPPPPHEAEAEADDESTTTASAACPEGMVLVSGNACSEARQTCLSWLDTDSGEVPKRCANFSTDVVCTGTRKPMKFCIDRWEYTKNPGEVPVANVSWTVSKDMCRSMGKRLCTEAEWVFACEGEDMLPYPTGYSREANKCHFDQMDLVDKKGKMRDLRRPGTEMPECKSPFGVMNMIGNVDEWTEREKAWTPWRASLKGGWWLAGRNRCRPATTGHDEYFFEVQTGFRCCKEAEGTPLREGRRRVVAGYDDRVPRLRKLFGLGVVSSLCLAGPLAHGAPALREPQRLPPDLSLWTESPALLQRLADERGKVSVLVDLEAEDVDTDQMAAWGVRRVAPGVGARTLSPDEVPGFFAKTSAARPWISPPLRPMLDRSAKLWTHTAVAHDAGRRGKGVLVGVVDTGLDVAHDDLRDPATGATRVAWLLDYARKPLGKHAALEAEFGCTGDSGPCAVLSREDIDAELASSTRSRDLVGHGTHVASLAAGNGGAKRRYLGGAPEADLVIARITRGTGETLAEADLLDAVRFLFDRGDALQRPIVTNVSLGGDFGPHDGTSLLERGLAAFVGPDKPGHALVVAAGNSGSLCVRENESYGVHTETRVLPGAVTRVPLRSPVTEGAINGGSFVWINLQPGDDVHIGVEWNGRTMLEPLAPGTSAAIKGNQQERYPYMAVINGVVGGTSPIQQGSYGAVVVLEGAWVSTDTFDIRLEGHGLAQVWVQGTGEASTDGACSGLALGGAIKQGTVSVPATHPALLAVGCTLNRTDWPTTDGTVGIDKLGGVDKPKLDSACYFSGAGPSATGVPKPEISAPGAFVVGAMSGDATPAKSTTSMFRAPKGTCDGHDCYVVDTDHGVASGTSMSAPQVTGAVALLLEADPTLSQPEIVALLQGGSRRFEGTVPFEYQVGPGALDVEGALASLAQRGAPRKLVPNAAQSWLSLAVGFARPDPSILFAGTLVLRADDGGIADGFDERLLALEIENGTVERPLTRQAPGVWTFSAAANGQAGGETLQIRARYGDAVLAVRNLPIAADATSLTTFPTADGGCTVGTAQIPFAPPSAPLAIVGAVALCGLISRRSNAGRRRSLRAAHTAHRRA